MKYIIVILIGIVAFNSTLHSQDKIDSVLIEIEKNNTTLAALQKRVEAETIGNKTGLYLQNPEVTLNYLWGNPAAIGNRTDFNITQTIDFPTAFRYRKQLSSLKNEQVVIEYQKARMELLLEARLACYDLIYTNALIGELSKRKTHSQSIAGSCKLKFEVGETNILEYNKAQLNLLVVSKEMEALNNNRNVLQGELTRLNGGIPIEFSVSISPIPTIPSDFEQWYAQAEKNSPLLNWLKKEQAVSQKQVSLNRAMSLPKLKAGYMSENVIGQEFQGITAGLLIPLWENKNTVKYAKANVIAIEKIAMDNKFQLYNHLKVLHTTAIALQANAADYKTKLQLLNNSELLKKALDKGEISLIEYMLELSIYYESINNILKLERDMNKTLAELNQYL